MMTNENQAPGRNPVFIFIGFLLLGIALALLIFGRDVFRGESADSPVILGESSTTVLGQVPTLPAVAAGDGSTPVEGQEGVIVSGSVARDFTLEDLDGNLVRLADFRGRPVIINFWATWCAPCRIEMPELQAAFEKYQADDLVILALNQDEPAETARAYFYDEMGLTFTPLLDDGSAVATDYGSFGVLPSTYFVDPDGVVQAVHRGPLTSGQIDGYLSQIIGESGS